MTLSKRPAGLGWLVSSCSFLSHAFCNFGPLVPATCHLQCSTRWFHANSTSSSRPTIQLAPLPPIETASVPSNCFCGQRRKEYTKHESKHSENTAKCERRVLSNLPHPLTPHPHQKNEPMQVHIQRATRRQCLDTKALKNAGDTIESGSFMILVFGLVVMLK